MSDMVPAPVQKQIPIFPCARPTGWQERPSPRVEYGIREPASSLHRSEVLIIHFPDGSILGIDTGSNVCNLSSEKPDLQPNDFHVDFFLQWVPEKT